MFKKIVRNLANIDYLVTVETGCFMVKKKGSEKEYLSFAVNDTDKETLLMRCYTELLGIKLKHIDNPE